MAENYQTGVFSPRFQSLKVEKADDFMSVPLYRLGSNERILISFDEIGEDNSYLCARLIHCNADWKPSSLVESEYLAGFNTTDIEDYAFSSNTFIHYVNYQLEIPNEDMTPLVSGNYLVQIYDRDEPAETLLQARFRVLEPVMQVGAGVTTRTDKGVNDRWQQLSITLDGEGMEDFNPYQDLKVEVTQNNREATSRFLPAPLRTIGKRVVYEHIPSLIFPASNEYRRFESTSVRFPGMNVDSTKYVGEIYHTWVRPDYPRADHNYDFDRTQHGRFLVKEYNATDSSIGADYIMVHFYLDTPELIGKDVYVDGEYNFHQLNDRNRMKYSGVFGGYVLNIPLKQGAYNYQYVVFPSGENGLGSTSEIEGDKYETENEYNVYVYLRRPGERYDRLVGAETVWMR